MSGQMQSDQKASEEIIKEQTLHGISFDYNICYILRRKLPSSWAGISRAR